MLSAIGQPKTQRRRRSNMTTRLIRSAILTTAALALPATAQVKWDAPTDMPASNPVMKNMEIFAQEVAEATDGKLTIVNHPSGTLFKSADVPRALQLSQVSIGEMPSGILENQN